jgi:hypothetical protein
MKAPTGLLLSTCAAMLALAACGGSPSGRGAPGTTSAAAVWQDYARCVRANGAPDFPDPTVDAAGNATFPNANVKNLPAATQSACAAILGRLPAQLRAGRPQDVGMLQRFAQCMRAHGIADWPDPDAEGRFGYPPSLVQAHAQHSAYWQQARAAWDGPCQRFDNGHIGDP